MNPLKLASLATPVHDALEIHRLVLIWYDGSRLSRVRQAAARDAIRRIEPLVRLAQRMVRSLGEDVAAEVQQDAYRKLFDSDRRVLAQVAPEATVAYIRQCLNNGALDALRALKRRAAVEKQPGDDRMAALADAEPGRYADAASERESDLSSFSARAAELSVEDRVGLLLTLCPDWIEPSEWETLVGGRRPPIPRPTNPVDDDMASQLLWPPSGPETREARARRMDRFRKRRARVIQALQKGKGEGP